jgi:hypothetical protein
MSNLEESKSSVNEQSGVNDRPKLELSLNIEHGSNCSCEFCGSPTEPTFETQLFQGLEIDYVAKIPSYTCTNSECGLEYIDNEAYINFLQIASEQALQQGELPESMQILQTELHRALLHHEQNLPNSVNN